MEGRGWGEYGVRVGGDAGYGKRVRVGGDEGR